MFGQILDRFKPKRLEDPTFGKLLFVKARDSNRSYWEGSGMFEPIGAYVHYTLTADEAGPGEAHCELYRRIELNFERLFMTAAPLLRRQYEASIGIACPPDIADAFRLDSLTIPRNESDDMEWEMSFSCSDGEDWLFTVPMKGWQPTGRIEVMH